MRGAFSPLECTAELWDGNQKLRFKVLDRSGNPLLRATSVLMSRARDPAGLRYIVKSARTRIEARGLELDPWDPAF